MAKQPHTPRGQSGRSVDKKELRKIFLIVCEGKKTEPNYFGNFPIPREVIEVRGLGQDPSRIVNKAKKLSEKGQYDRVWCVFDRDSCPPENFNNAIQNARQAGFGVAYSNEAFDLWYILHFEFLNTAFPRDRYTEKLTKHLGYKYEKNDPDMYDKLIDRQPEAIRNAINLLKQYDPPNPKQNNPSTTVHLLVEELNKHAR